MADIALLKVLKTHLDDVAAGAATIDKRLLESVTDEFCSSLSCRDRTDLVNQFATILLQSGDIIDLVVDVTSRLIEPDVFTFLDVLAIKPAVNFVQAFQTPIPSINKLALALLAKASASASIGDVSIAAGDRDVIIALVTLWLTSPYTGVADKATKVITSLLSAENPEQIVADQRDLATSLSDRPSSRDSSASFGSSGLMWRRFVNDKDVYKLFFSLCSLPAPGRRDITVTTAQGRLLDLLKGFCLAPQFWRAQIPEIESRYGVPNGGLLEFATTVMVDSDNDEIMYCVLLEFFAHFISEKGGIAKIAQHSSETLDFMISHGLHHKTMSHFLDVGSGSSSSIVEASAQYVAAYARNYKSHFLEIDCDRSEDIIRRLYHMIRSTRPSAWGNNQEPTVALQVLLSVPRKALVSRPHQESPLLILPSSPPNARVYNILAEVFNPRDLESDTMLSLERVDEEKAAARTLFFQYHAKNTRLWDDLVHAADFVIEMAALGALMLVESLIDAQWYRFEGGNLQAQAAVFKLPTEHELERQCQALYTPPLPTDGLMVILGLGKAQTIMQYLLNRGTSRSTEFSVQTKQIAILRKIRDRLDSIATPGSDRHLIMMLDAVKYSIQMGGRRERVQQPSVMVTELTR